MSVIDPLATYTSPKESHNFTTSQLKDSELSTNGKTTGPSEFVLKAGIIDKDKPSDHKDTYLGKLRAKLTYLQDDVNEYLTNKMKEEEGSQSNNEKEFETKILDGADEDSDEE